MTFEHRLAALARTVDILPTSLQFKRIGVGPGSQNQVWELKDTENDEAVYFTPGGSAALERQGLTQIYIEAVGTDDPEEALCAIEDLYGLNKANLFLDILNEREGKPLPAWAVICTKSGGILTHSSSMEEDILAGGPTADSVGLDTYTPNTGLVMWEGTMRAVPTGTLDGIPGGYEYDWEMKGKFRPLTEDEALQVARGEL